MTIQTYLETVDEKVEERVARARSLEDIAKTISHGRELISEMPERLENAHLETGEHYGCEKDSSYNALREALTFFYENFGRRNNSAYSDEDTQRTYWVACNLVDKFYNRSLTQKEYAIFEGANDQEEANANLHRYTIENELYADRFPKIDENELFKNIGLRNSLRNLKSILEEKSECSGEPMHGDIRVTKTDYGKKYPGLGKHTEYSFWAHVLNDAGDIKSFVPLDYSVMIFPKGIGYNVTDNLGLKGAENLQRVFDYAFTKRGAEKKAQARAKRALSLVEKYTGVKKVKESTTDGFVRL